MKDVRFLTYSSFMLSMGHGFLSSSVARAQPCSREYLQILQSFGDSESCPFSIHKLLEAGTPFGLAAGSWLGPYALCRTLEALAKADRNQSHKIVGQRALPFAVYVVSGEAEGERGGAPVLCVEDVALLCSKWGEPTEEWSPLLLLVPLVLGLDKVNPRFVMSYSVRLLRCLLFCNDKFFSKGMDVC